MLTVTAQGYERKGYAMSTDDRLSLVLFSGTDDKLHAAAVLTVGAAAMGRKVNVFLQYWALDAFRADRILKDHGVVAGGRSRGLSARCGDQGKTHWSELFRQAKDLGEVQHPRLRATRWRCSTSRPTTSIRWSTASGASRRFFMDADGPVTFI